jgi:hypothetical protein
MADILGSLHGYGLIAILTGVGLALAVAAVLLVLVPPPRYVRQKTLFSQSEMAFLRALEGVVGVEDRIYAKVRMCDVVTPNGMTGTRRWWRAFTKVSSKHLDYVLVDRQTGTIKLAIELDDKSHHQDRRKVRDAFVNRACAQAGVTLLRIPAAGRYDRDELRAQLAQTQVHEPRVHPRAGSGGTRHSGQA